ncbi:MAG: lipoate-protein ligase [Micavibrio sp.]|nr:lipoate-protein ligase [Micavibrio sp.]
MVNKQFYDYIIFMEWLISPAQVLYEDALALMEGRVEDIHEGRAEDLIWLLEHPPIYTAGTSADPADLRDPPFPVIETGRGGEYTYHGPGQRVGYIMLNLKNRQQVPDIKKYVWQLEEWIIRSLGRLGVAGERRTGRIGIWVVTPEGEKKIAAIGVRIRHWITFHGISINVNPDLAHFGGIVPCGIAEYGVTSLKELGVAGDMAALDHALRVTWEEVF